MVEIKSLDEIDREKLRLLFKKRGHGILLYGFYKNLQLALEDENSEVHQCECGELMTVHKDQIADLRKRFGSDELRCKRCWPYEDEVFDFTILEKVEKIIKITEKYSKSPGNKIGDKDIKRIEELARGLFPAGHSDEFIMGFYFFAEAIRVYFNPSDKKNKFKTLVEDLVSKVRKKNPSEFNRIFEVVDSGAMLIESLNVSDHIINLGKRKKHFEDAILMGAYLTEDSGFESEEVLVQLGAYKDLLESKKILEFLLNLLLILEGETASERPFKKIRLIEGSKTRRVNGLKDMVEAFNTLKTGKKLYGIMSVLYDTQLRNAYSHNQYKIIKDSKVIELTKYKRKLSFKKFKKIFDDLSKLHAAVNDAFYKSFHHIKHPDFENWGLEAVILGYTDPEVIDEQLYPGKELTPQLNVLQYWSFSFVKSGERYIPIPKISVSKKDRVVIFKFGKQNSMSFPLDSEETQRWIDYLIIRGGYVLSLQTIAPKMPIFNKIAEFSIPLGRTGVLVNVLGITEKFIEIPPKFLNDIFYQIEGMKS